MKRLIVCAAVMASALGALAQADPVLMTINGKDITRSEFEYSYNKNNSEGVIDKKTIEEYVPLFIDFKLKVAAAEAAKYDTLTSIQKDLRSYKEQTLLPTIIDKGFLEREARKTYERTAERYQGQDILTASHILVMMRQDATDAQMQAAKVRIDSIYQALKNGADFAELAARCSDDKGSAVKGGSLGQFGKGMMIPDFENAAYALKAGEMSAPFKSTVGWHIILLKDRHPFESYEFHRESILKFLEQRGYNEASANFHIDSIARMRNVERDVIVNELFDALVAKDPEAKHLSQEYYDGTMMYEFCKNEIWDVAAADEAGMIAYYNKNKKNYQWTAPRFKGIVINAKDEKYIAQAKELVKKVKDDALWGQMIVKEINTDSLKNIRIEHGVYEKGENQNVDVIMFGENKPLKPLVGYPATDVYGRLIKKPESYKDVKGELSADYQNAVEKQFVEGLRKKFKYSVNDDVLKTVNKH